MSDLLTRRRIPWRRFTTDQIRAVLLEARAAGDHDLTARCRLALARRGVR